MTRPKPLAQLSPAYRQRIEVGMGRGLSRQEARGHAGPKGESHYPKRPSPGKVIPPTPPPGGGGGGIRESAFERRVREILEDGQRDGQVEIEDIAEILGLVNEAREYLKEAGYGVGTLTAHLELLQQLRDLLGSYFYPLMRLLYTGKR